MDELANVNFITDYEEIGIPGKTSLRQLLSEAFQGKSLEEINNFQFHNGIILPSLKPMLPLLYLLGVRSLEFHQSVMEELREKLINRIEEISQKMDPQTREAKLKALLAKSFPLIKIPMLQPVVMALLKNVDVVEDKYLKLLVADESLYKKCDVSVKRHIWQEHQSLLVNELSPLLVQYIKEKEAIFANIKEPRQSFFLLTPKQRRQNEVLQTLAQMVGKNVLLYDTILQFLRTVYLHTKNPHYCTLRVSLLMELHDANITDITSMDACHKFAWCLDACIRENTVDLKRVRELQGFLDNIKKGQEQVLGDLAMALVDPYAINFLVQTVMRILNTQIANEACPREHQTLQFLLRLLNLGLHAFEILQTQSFREPKFNPEILTRFLPIVMGFMVDDQVRSVNAKLPPDDRESALTIIEHCGPPPDCFQSFIQQDPLAAVIAIYYTAQAARQRDRQAVTRVLGTLTLQSTFDNLSYSDPYQHILASGLISMSEEFSHEDLCSLVFDEIFFPALNMNSTAIHLIKLIYHVHQWLPKERLESSMSSLQQYVQIPDTKDVVRNTFTELIQRIEKVKEEKAQQKSVQSTTQQQQQQSQSGQQQNLDNPGSVSVRIPSSHPMMTPAPHSYHHQAPMSPYYGGPMSPYSAHGASGGPMSPMPYQSPFNPSSHHRSSSSSVDSSYPSSTY